MAEKRLIDAVPIKKFIEDGLNNPDKKKTFGHDAIEILTEIEYAPIVDAVEVVNGRWIRRETNAMFLWKLECSVCGNDLFATAGYNYCPNCGAKMESE